MLNILVIGSGGREHSIGKKFKESDKVGEVYCAKGNPGMASDGIKLVDIAEDDHEALIAFAKENNIDWAFIGPEIPLMAGIVDDFEAAGLKAFGPHKNAAMIEGSKDFAKNLMNRYNIPTANHQTFTDYKAARAYVEAKGAPIVIKADGLAAGKGVVVAETLDQAVEALKDMLLDHAFGGSGASVVVEDFLDGQEFSLLAFVNGEEVYPMVIAQDHKRAYDGDRGPNTGGMGAYAPVPQIPQEMVDKAVEEIVKPAAAGMKADGNYFRGILYAGLIATKDGAKVIEFNARFGDPETQVVLPRLTSDFALIIDDLLNDRKPVVTFKEDGYTLGVVVAADGYPGSYDKGAKIPDTTKLVDSTAIFAGVANDAEGKLVANGGRVYLVFAEGDTLKEAQEKVYNELNDLKNDGMFYRTDIGAKAF
ncbi:MAG: phosphoribosylamine--glycine ligase [Lactobacillales bacterium]|jgi:phosphoribosylamine--glycine ligase|nr:phosphoribosylamine--glycine ligase [Lactobacillales bacterium]